MTSRVLFDPSGDFRGQEFRTDEIGYMVEFGALEPGAIYEVDGQRYEVVLTLDKKGRPRQEGRRIDDA